MADFVRITRVTSERREAWGTLLEPAGWDKRVYVDFKHAVDNAAVEPLRPDDILCGELESGPRGLSLRNYRPAYQTVQT